MKNHQSVLCKKSIDIRQHICRACWLLAAAGVVSYIVNDLRFFAGRLLEVFTEHTQQQEEDSQYQTK
jgi:hypothetical protein